MVYHVVKRFYLRAIYINHGNMIKKYVSLLVVIKNHLICLTLSNSLIITVLFLSSGADQKGQVCTIDKGLA